ncbi:serine hydroxymethyltransferase [Beijerinckia sp. L45]|uniref:serine hydroxymethyltransferase n=1 Tax=Beijerinckia sp. L45 TaxID=1641855 RepID=UPI00131B9765|nr:serine hydroxymethyltransferase [Beijerinckia sp. L45]
MTKSDAWTDSTAFFNADLHAVDPDMAKAIDQELGRQRDEIELIASENIVSRAVLEAQGSILTNKYAEGYPGRRYYGGCQYVDIAERLAIERACKLFGVGFANVQPNSGSQANQAVFLALLQPGDTFMGLDLAAGGHLTHGSPVNVSGKWFKPIPYGVKPDDHRIDMESVAKLALEHKPKLIIAGGSAYPRHWDFAKFREIADSVGAFFMVDMAHFAGLIAADLHPSPFPHAHVATTTTHKTLRGPRGGLIMTDDAALAKKFNSAIFPGIQGGPLMHVIAAKGVAFGEALQPSFKVYIQQVLDNAKALAATLAEKGFAISSGGTDNHLLLVDLRKQGLTGKAAEASLGRAHITCNKNGVPFDTASPMVTSGIRLGSPAATSRGFGVDEFKQVGELIATCLLGLAANGEEGNVETETKVRNEVAALTKRFPIY